MPKWADWLILQVRYNAQHTHIDSVRIAPGLDTGLGAMETWARLKAVQTIQAGRTVYTAPPSKTELGKVDKGAKVEVVLIDNQQFIKTVRDNTKRDNLGELPEF